MTIHCVEADRVPAQPWRNGGGRTRELLAWPDATDWQCRISRADIDADGPFSAFPGVERWFTVLSGAGVVLSFADAPMQLRAGDAPLRFDGAAAPGCRLLDGATQDLNLMARAGRGLMQAVQPDAPWHPAGRLCGLYALGAGTWQGDGESRPLGAHTLLWSADATQSTWRFTPAQQSAQTQAWWLGFQPD